MSPFNACQTLATVMVGTYGHSTSRRPTDSAKLAKNRTLIDIFNLRPALLFGMAFYTSVRPRNGALAMAELTHLDQHGHARMVDVGDKASTHRRAVASGRILMQADTVAQIAAGTHKKGDVLAVARVAGIMAAKRTPELIPLCHPIQLTKVDIELLLEHQPPAVLCRGSVETLGQTGVEIEALNAVQIALLTVYDMCKAVDRGMVITDVGLEAKSGGRSGSWQRDE